MEGEKKRKIVSIALFATVMVVELIVCRDAAAQIAQDSIWFLGIGGCVIFGVGGVLFGSGVSSYPDWITFRPITGLTGRDIGVCLLPTVMLAMGVTYLILGGPVLAFGAVQFAIGLVYCLGIALGIWARSLSGGGSLR